MELTLKQKQALEIYERLGSYNAGGKELGMSRQAFTAIVNTAFKNKAMHADAEPGYYKDSAILEDGDGNVMLRWKKPDADNIEKIALEMIDGLNRVIPRIPRTKMPKIERGAPDRMNAYVFGDSHVNMLAWSPECPTGDWDISIALARHLAAMNDLIDRAPLAATGLLLTLGDLLHNDSLKPFTAHGTQVDVDGRLGKGWDALVAMIRGMIDRMLLKYKHVTYSCVRGNHSETLELILAKTMAIAYEKEPRVTILDNTCKHIPYVWENNFLCMTHGNTLNDQKKANIAVGMYRDLHGAAKFTHLLSGHVHHARQVEISGVLVETFPALPTPDAWHTGAGFITADQSATVLSYHKGGGITERTTSFPRIDMRKK